MTSVPIIDREKFKSEIGKTLYDKLKEIYDEPHFLFCVISRLVGDEQKQKLLDVINDGITDDEQITLYSLAINKGMI